MCLDLVLERSQSFVFQIFLDLLCLDKLTVCRIDRLSRRSKVEMRLNVLRQSETERGPEHSHRINAQGCKLALERRHTNKATLMSLER